jgi:hypothetical protein
MNNAWPVHLGVSTPEPALTTDAGLEVVVVYTSVKQTLAALRTAGSLANDLGARIRMVVPEIVPFPAPLDQPLVERSFAERKFRTIAGASAVETTVNICLCREREDGVLQSVKPRSIVVLGAAKRWWRSRGERALARMLRNRGHQVILAESE